MAPGARYLHLATHGLAEELSGRSFSALALTMTGVPSDADNGFLTLLDLLSRWGDRLSGCRMVVLSACRSAVSAGPQRRDEAVQALPMGFFFAGASSVVATLWNVDDVSTAELMSDFYRRLAAARESGLVDRLQALHEARRALKQRYAHPTHWAPFLLFGNPR